MILRRGGRIPAPLSSYVRKSAERGERTAYLNLLYILKIKQFCKFSSVEVVIALQTSQSVKSHTYRAKMIFLIIIPIPILPITLNLSHQIEPSAKMWIMAGMPDIMRRLQVTEFYN